MIDEPDMIDEPEDSSSRGTGTILVACAIVALLLFAFWSGTNIGTDLGQAIFGTKR